MTFSNKATLSYNGNVIDSNIVTGEVASPLSLYKSASADTYSPGAQIEYTVTIVNSSATAYSSLSLLDNLGSYDFEGFLRFPLSYIENSATLKYYSASGTVSATVAAAQSNYGILFTFDIPGNSVALLRYFVDVTVFAPLSLGSKIVNTAVLSGEAPRLPLNASLSLPVKPELNLEISKATCGTAVNGQELTFVFTISNYGNIAVNDTDYIVLSDLFSPPLKNITVYAGGEMWTEGVQYVYDERLFYFQTQYGAIKLAEADFVQDDFGRWNALPSSLEIRVTGTVSAENPEQPLMEILPAYTDGREAYLSVQRVQNDYFTLSRTGDVPAEFIILARPSATFSLTPASHPNFTLSNKVLSVGTAGIAETITAYVNVDYGSGFVVRIDYVP